MASSNTGTCFLCNDKVSHRSITKHIEKCLVNDASHQPSEKESIFLIKVYCGKAFWLYIEINGSAKLGDLDDYLRRIWLECCGHMSQLKINDQRYSSNGGMNKSIYQTLTKVDTDFDYEYDFGSTTWLAGKVISSRPGQLKNKIRLVARNHLPADLLCETCQKKPDIICMECQELVCETCKEDHSGCGEDFMLPVVNSPRMGVCGYCGPDL